MALAIGLFFQRSCQRHFSHIRKKEKKEKKHRIVNANILEKNNWGGRRRIGSEEDDGKKEGMCVTSVVQLSFGETPSSDCPSTSVWAEG